MNGTGSRAKGADFSTVCAAFRRAGNQSSSRVDLVSLKRNEGTIIGAPQAHLTTVRGPARSMHVSQERYGDALVLTPVGRVDNSTTDGLKSGLDAYVATCRAGGDRLVLDFSKVDYISSVGLRVLMLAAKQIREQGGSIVVAALQPVVREIFEISRFNLVFQCFGSVREALAKVSPTALAAYDSAHGT